MILSLMMPNSLPSLLNSFLLLIHRPPSSTLFPYTTLFRSQPVLAVATVEPVRDRPLGRAVLRHVGVEQVERAVTNRDRKSTRLNSSHVEISYAVFCLKKKKKHENAYLMTNI